jgi:putative oxidoreductase
MTALGLLVLRLAVGLIVAAHGAQKLFGWWGGSGVDGWAGTISKLRVRPAKLWAWISVLSELGGGLLFALGFLSPLGSMAIAGTMLVALVAVHLPNGFWNTKRGYEFNLTLIAVVVAVAITGPGAYSLDQLFGIRPPEPITLIVGAVLVIAGVATTLLSRSPVPVEAAKAQPAA